MKVGLIYTSTTPELIELVEREVKKQLGGNVEMLSLEDPSILAETREAGYVTTAAAARLIGMESGEELDAHTLKQLMHHSPSSEYQACTAEYREKYLQPLLEEKAS